MTWSWDQDVNNPQNWTMKKKCYNTLVVLLYSFAIVFAAAMYLPGYPALALEFQVSPTTTVSGFTLFILGLAFGPLLGVVLGDTYGRRAIYGLALPLSSLFTMGAGLANNVGAVVACRFFAAILASPAVATGWFVVADIWSLEKTNLPTMFYMYTMCGGPCLGPLIGGFAVQYGNWPWTMWVTLMVSGVIYMLSYFLSETHKTQILYQRDQLLRKTEELPSPPPSAGLQGAISDIRRSASRRLRKPRAPSALKQNRKVVLKTGFQVTIMHAAKMLVIEPLVTLISLYVGFVFGCLFQTLVSVPLVFGVVYKLDAIESGFTILGIAGGMFLSLLVLVVLDLTIHRRAQRRIMTWLGGRLAPEERLSLALIGSIMFPISLFWWAWGARENVHWFLPILGGITVGFAGFSIILGMTLYLHETYSGDTFVSAISAATTIQCLLGALFPLFTIPLYKSLSIGWAGSVMAFLSLIFVPVPWVIWRWGRNLRGRSSFGVNVFCERERR
ncbi:MFS multidrug transporter-like protein [Kalaharituber pfeilii]|nr:MFS multidrug transporter-like protein [Kalaharituber pfeilii]